MARVIDFVPGKRVNCDNCMAIIEYYNHDVKIQSIIDKVFIEKTEVKFIKCPGCRSVIELKE